MRTTLTVCGMILATTFAFSGSALAWEEPIGPYDMPCNLNMHEPPCSTALDDLCIGFDCCFRPWGPLGCLIG